MNFISHLNTSKKQIYFFPQGNNLLKGNLAQNSVSMWSVSSLGVGDCHANIISHANNQKNCPIKQIFKSEIILEQTDQALVINSFMFSHFHLSLSLEE